MPLSSTSFQIEVEFAVDGKAHNLFGDGFAMWLSKDRGTLGPVFGSVGGSGVMYTIPWDSAECVRRLLQRLGHLLRYVSTRWHRL